MSGRPTTRWGDTASALARADLAVLLPDWRTHLLSRNVALSTISSYLTVGENLLRHLRQHAASRSMAATVDGYQRRPLCAVGTLSASSPAAIAASDRPAARSATTRATTSAGTRSGRPKVAPAWRFACMAADVR